MFSPEAFALAEGLVSSAYVSQGSQACARRGKLLTTLLSERRLPRAGWDDKSIEALIAELAAMDSNNFLDNVGVGEREARVHSRLVARRHYHLAHGVGRSGDVAAEQPKAAGSSLIVFLPSRGRAFRSREEDRARGARRARRARDAANGGVGDGVSDERDAAGRRVRGRRGVCRDLASGMRTGRRETSARA